MKESQVQNFTTGNIPKQLWKIAWPMMLSIWFYTLYNLVDTFWVSKISTEAIAAVWISQVAMMVMMSVTMWIAIGSSVLMSMNLWSNNKKEAARVMAQSFVLATIVWIIFTTLFLIFREEILRASWAVWDVFSPALLYFTIVAIWGILMAYLINIMMIFNAEWDTFTVTKLFAVSTVVNIILDPLLIFWKFWIPAMWIAWAAYATIISQTIFILLAMRVLSSHKRRVYFSFKNISFQLQSVKKVLNIWIPAACTQALNPIWLAIITYLVAHKFMENGAAAFSLVFRLEFFAYLPAVWFSMAAMSMIGQSMWAGNIKRANDIFKKAALMWFSTAIILWLILIISWKFLLGFFTENVTVINYSLHYLYIVAWTYGFFALSMIISAAFQATWKSWPGFWLIFIKLFLITIPLSYIIVHYTNLDIKYIWMALALWNILTATFGLIWNKIYFNNLNKKSTKNIIT